MQQKRDSDWQQLLRDVLLVVQTLDHSAAASSSSSPSSSSLSEKQMIAAVYKRFISSLLMSENYTLAATYIDPESGLLPISDAVAIVCECCDSYCDSCDSLNDTTTLSKASKWFLSPVSLFLSRCSSLFLPSPASVWFGRHSAAHLQLMVHVERMNSCVSDVFHVSMV